MELYDHIKRPGPPPAAFGPPPPVPVINVPPVPPSPAPVYYQQGIFESIGHTFRDLYPYYPEDSNLWLELFIIADQVASSDFANRLEFIRHVGARLVPDQQFGFRIEPIIDLAGMKGWASREQYDQESRVLDPYIKEVVIAIKELNIRYQSGTLRWKG